MIVCSNKALATSIVSRCFEERRFAATPSSCLPVWQGALPARLGGEVRLLCERLALVSGNAVARGAERLLVSNDRPAPGVAGCWVTLEEAVRAVTLPTCILVENIVNDRAFLRRLMPPDWRERLDQWENAGLLRYEHGGGINGIATLVKHFSDDDRCRQAFGLPSRLWRLVHIIVYDHDGEQPEQPGEGARQVERACRDAGLDEHSHRLQRRDQEHYLPPEALQKIVHAHQWQSDHDREQFTAKIKTHIERGYDRHFTELPRLGKEPFFKNEFDRPADWFDDDWFRRDGAWPEMTLLAEKIAAAI
jgi:hypothetical protein